MSAVVNAWRGIERRARAAVAERRRAAGRVEYTCHELAKMRKEQRKTLRRGYSGYMEKLAEQAAEAYE
eukprot:1924162-Lingulodinium_polyedra.AAC.1